MSVSMVKISWNALKISWKSILSYSFAQGKFFRNQEISCKSGHLLKTGISVRGSIIYCTICDALLFRYGQLKLGWKTTHLSILRFLLYYIPWFFIYDLQVISDWFSNIFPQKIQHFLQPVISKTILLGNFKSQFLKLTRLLSYTQMVIKSKSRSRMNLILVSN